MRVIAGSARGTGLKGPPTSATRPTSDKVRGAIFNALAAYLPEARVLDLYAGTGALGIEALSRGAASCLFVEKVASVCAVIETNLRVARVQERASVWCLSVERALERLGGTVDSGATFGRPYDLLLLDPPYDENGIGTVLERLAANGFVAADGLVVLEHSKRVTPGDPASWQPLRTKRYGDTAVTIWQCVEGDA